MKLTLIFFLNVGFIMVGCNQDNQQRSMMKNGQRTIGNPIVKNADAQRTLEGSKDANPNVTQNTSTNLAGSIPLEVKIESITSNTDGRQAPDPRKASNIFSLAAGKDPYFDKLAKGTTHILENFAYLRDDPERTIVLSVPLIAVERTYTGTERNMWWVVDGVIKVTESSGKWALGDKFSKHAKDGYGEQWSFNYVISRMKTSP